MPFELFAHFRHQTVHKAPGATLIKVCSFIRNLISHSSCHNTLLIRMDHYFWSELYQNLWRTHVLHRCPPHAAQPVNSLRGMGPQKSVEDMCPPYILVQFRPNIMVHSNSERVQGSYKIIRVSFSVVFTS